LIRRYRGLVILIALVAASLAVLMVPQLRLNAFGNTFSRGEANSFLGLKLGLDLQGGTHLVYRVVPEGGGTPSADDVAAVRLTIDRRVNEFGVSEATVQELGNPPDRIIVQIPGQKGASLNINFRPSLFGPIYSAQQVEDFFRSDLGRPDAKVTQDPADFSINVQLDSIRPAELDADGNVLVAGEAEEWRPLIEEKFPATVVIGFAGVTPEGDTSADATATPEASATPESTATPEPAAEPVFPSVEQVQQALILAGFAGLTVEELAKGQYAVDIIGLKPARTAADGTAIAADLDRIRDEVRLLGELTIFAPQGDITGWTVGGGVEEAKALIGSTAKLEFRERICGDLTAPPGVDVWPPDGLTLDEWASVRCQDPRYYQEQATPIDASDLTDAFAGTVEGIARPVVNIVFNDDGADAFFEVTDRISRTGNLLAIYLDGVELVAPSASEGISGGRAYINGPDFTAERARTISIQLRSGALPATLELIQERNVDATLGEESLRQSLIAGAIGLALLLVFMVAYYKVPGIVAALMLATYTIMLLAIFKLVPVTMTLSGAAAIILSLGFAVDANILIAERIKEELRTGRSLLSAINIGFDRAWSSIRDGNVSTLLTAAVLFWFGDRFSTSIMQGFALTLGIGVLLSMLTAYFFSRVLMRLIARTSLGGHTNLFVPVADSSSASVDGEA
jgi:protein-export membrane protein SecD